MLALEPVIDGRSQLATVRLQRSDQTVSVRCKDLGERWEAGKASAADTAGRQDKSQGGDREREGKNSKREQKRGMESDRGGSEQKKEKVGTFNMLVHEWKILY